MLETVYAVDGILLEVKKIIFLTLGALLIFSSAYLLGRSQASTEKKNNYDLLAKRLFIESPNDPIVNFALLRDKIRTYNTEHDLSGSIYFEYLPTGTSIRVEGDTELVAASLMKIPVVMELYRAAELGRISLDNTVELKEEWLDSRYGTLYQKGAGYSISMRDAARLALEESDNTALAAIGFTASKLLSQEENSIAALDVSFSRDSNKEILISARSYSSFLKCLYFSCYLTHDHS